MEITQLKLDKIKPYGKNAKTHPEEQVALIANSIKEFGFRTPIVVDENFIIIQGHGRRLASIELGLTEVPCVIADDLTKDQVKMLRLADNKVAESDWDIDMLNEELETLIDLFEVEDFGFEFELPEEVDKTEVEDIVPEPADNPVIKRGDRIRLGEHTLLCGDSTKMADIETLLQDKSNKKTHFISDPPYGISYNPEVDKYDMIKNDDTFLDFIGLGKEYTDGFFFMWTSYQVVDEWIARIKEEFGKINNMIIWHKGGGGLGDCRRTLSTDFEIALVVNRGNFLQGHRGGSVWDMQPEEREDFIQNAKKDQLQEAMRALVEGETIWRVGKDHTAHYLHPTQKPVEINERALENFTAFGDNVVDLFLGSGSNMIACENMGRKCYGMELDETYAQIIVQRYCDYTEEDTIEINGKEVSWEEYKETHFDK